MEMVEEIRELADGVEYTMWTFGGSVPEKFIRVREGDLIEFHLKNHPNNKLPHNILDLHSVNGPEGSDEATFTVPGLRKYLQNLMSGNSERKETGDFDF